MLFESARAD